MVSGRSVYVGKLALWDSTGYCVGHAWYGSAGSVSRHQFRLFSWLFLWPLATCQGKALAWLLDSLLFGSVRWSMESSLAAPLIHHICGCAAGLVFGFYCGGFRWRGDQSLGWETLGGIGPWPSESRADGVGGFLVCPVICAVLLLILSLRHHQFKNTIYGKFAT